MTHLSANVRTKGCIRLVLSDINTGEIQHEREVENVVTNAGETIMLVLGPGGAGNVSDFFGYQTSYSSNVAYLSERPVIEDKGFPGAMLDSTLLCNGTQVDTNTITRQADPLPDYVTLHTRFNPGGSTRNIWAIGIGQASQTASTAPPTLTYASLSSPCVQTTSQVLDVYYRVELYTSTVTGSSSDVAVIKDFDKQMNSWFIYPNTTGQTSNSAYLPVFNDNWFGYGGMYAHGITNLPPNGLYSTAITDLGDPTGGYNSSKYTVTGDPYYLKQLYNITNTVAQDIGRLYGMISIGGQGYQTTTITTPQYSNQFAFAKFGNSTFSYKPIQPIFNHSIGTNQPFLDVSNLATGQGYLNVNGSAWTGLTNPQYSDFYRVDIRQTGNIGTAKYAFSKRHITGFAGGNATTSTYFPTGMFAPFGIPQAFPTGHNHDLKINQAEQYNDETMIFFNAYGISYYRMLASLSANFDSSSSPALPVNPSTGKIQQVAVDSGGAIWVADAVSGLYKITSPLTSPAITTVTKSGATVCYSVAVGNGGKVWALFDTGLAYTTNGGTSWTAATLTLPVGSFTAYSNCLFMRCDQQSSIDQMAFVVSTTNTMYWWDSTSSTLTAGSSITPASAVALYGQLRCSNPNSFWVSISGAYPYILTPGSASTTLLGTYYAYSTNVVFWYDSFGNAYTPTINYAGGYNSEIYNKEGTSYGFQTENTWLSVVNGFSPTSNFNTLMNFFSSGGIMLAGARILSMPSPGYGPNVSGGTPITIDPWNGKGTVWQDFVWRNYRWNGSAWTLGYNAPALDTSGNSYTATRYNFDLESQTFTGRSLVDVTPMLVASNFGTSTTFAAYVNSAAKPIIAESKYMLFDIYDPNTGARLAFYWKSGGNLALIAGTTTYTFGATPANGSNHRVVLVVSGTSASAYIDGTQSGSTQTITSQNLSNTGAIAQGYIGSRTAKSGLVVDFFQGSMTNNQFWNGAWDSTDISNDAAAPTAVISSPSSGGASVKAVYQLTSSLVGLETKTTSATPSAMLDGITIGFTDGPAGITTLGSITGGSSYTDGTYTNVSLTGGSGTNAKATIVVASGTVTTVTVTTVGSGYLVSDVLSATSASIGGTGSGFSVPVASVTIIGNSFVDTDYYTYGVVDGILKDNATNFSWDFPLLTKPNRVQTTFTNTSNTNVIPSSASSNITERATWARYTETYGIPSFPAIYPGSFGSPEYRGYGTSNTNAAVFSQTITGDGFIQFVAPAGNLDDVYVGFAASTTFTPGSSNPNGLTHSIRLLSDGTWQPYESGSPVSTSTAYAIGDTFKINRTGTTVTYYKNNTLAFTSSTSSSGTIECVAMPRGPGTGVTSVVINYSIPAGFMSVGSSVSSTGVYDPIYRWIEPSVQTMNISLNGTPLSQVSSIIVVTNKTLDQMVTQGVGPGVVLVNPTSGKLYFNSANYGNAVTGSVVEVTDT